MIQRTCKINSLFLISLPFPLISPLSRSNSTKLREYFIKELLPQGKQMKFGKRMVTRADTVECYGSVIDRKLIKKLEEHEM